MFVRLNIQSDALTDSVRTCIDDEIVIYIQKVKVNQHVILTQQIKKFYLYLYLFFRLIFRIFGISSKICCRIFFV